MVVPAVLTLYKHVNDKAVTLKNLGPVARVLRDSLMKRFEGVFAAVDMAHSLVLSTSPFSSRVFLIATILDPNYQLYWIDDLVDVDTDEDVVAVKATLKAKLKGICFMHEIASER